MFRQSAKQKVEFPEAVCLKAVSDGSRLSRPSVIIEDGGLKVLASNLCELKELDYYDNPDPSREKSRAHLLQPRQRRAPSYRAP
jgi:hypothetical protein